MAEDTVMCDGRDAPLSAATAAAALREGGKGEPEVQHLLQAWRKQELTDTQLLEAVRGALPLALKCTLEAAKLADARGMRALQLVTSWCARDEAPWDRTDLVACMLAACGNEDVPLIALQVLCTRCGDDVLAVMKESDAVRCALLAARRSGRDDIATYVMSRTSTRSRFEMADLEDAAALISERCGARCGVDAYIDLKATLCEVTRPDLTVTRTIAAELPCDIFWLAFEAAFIPLHPKSQRAALLANPNVDVRAALNNRGESLLTYLLTVKPPSPNMYAGVLQWLVECAGADVSAPDANGIYPLHAAADAGDVASLEYLASLSCVDFGVVNAAGVTAEARFAANGIPAVSARCAHATPVDALLACDLQALRRMPIDWELYRGPLLEATLCSALCDSKKTNQVVVLRILHQRGCDLALPFNASFTPLTCASLLTSVGVNVLKYIVEVARVPLNAADPEGYSAIHRAVQSRDEDKLCALLQYRGLDIDGRDIGATARVAETSLQLAKRLGLDAFHDLLAGAKVGRPVSSSRVNHTTCVDA